MLNTIQTFNYGFLEQGMISILPEAVIIFFAFIVLFLSFSEKLSKSENPYYISLMGILFSMLYIFMLKGAFVIGFYGSVVLNKFEIFIFILILFSGFFTILMSKSYIEKFNMPVPEYYSLVLFGIAAMMMLVSSNNLIMIFLSIEFMSITAYILTGYLRESTRSVEAALKYFVLGAFASGFLIFGAMFIYAASGHLQLQNIHDFLIKSLNSAYNSYPDVKIYLTAGLILFLIGLAFKMSLFPFHAWTPDAYDGAPTPVTSFMATGIKVASIAIFLRIFYLIYNFNFINFYDIIWILAVLSMTFGNIAAIMSTNIKRLLAYSSIAQAGYILTGIVGGGSYGYSGTLFYMLAYVFMTAGAFAIVVIFENVDILSLDIKKYSGIAYKYPLLSASFVFFLLSFAGIPLTSGFMGKFYVFSAAIKSKYGILALIAFINSAFAAFYYIKIIVNMYMPGKEYSVIDDSKNISLNSNSFGITGGRINNELIIIVAVCIFFTLLMGIYPQVFINFANSSVQSLWQI